MWRIHSDRKRNAIRKVAKKFHLLKPLRCIRFIMGNIWILEIEYGHLNSLLKWTCIDENGKPIPWYTYPAIEYLSQFDLAGKTIFEYGAGNSSLFFSERAKSVISVEDNEFWHQKIKSKQRSNHEVLLAQDKEDYVNSIKLREAYDIIVIDGSHRYECSQIAPRFLAPGGMIILDNSDWHPECAHELRKADLIQIDFKGFAPMGGWTSATSIFLSREFDFGSIHETQPSPGIGSHQENRDIVAYSS